MRKWSNEYLLYYNSYNIMDELRVKLERHFLQNCCFGRNMLQKTFLYLSESYLQRNEQDKALASNKKFVK